MINSLTNWLIKDYARTSLAILSLISWFNGWLIISIIKSADWPTKLCHKSVYWMLIFWGCKLFDEIYCWLIGGADRFMYSYFSIHECFYRFKSLLIVFIKVDSRNPYQYAPNGLKLVKVQSSLYVHCDGQMDGLAKQCVQVALVK